MRLKYCSIIKNFFLIIFLCISFNSFAHNENFNEKEKKLENELRDDKNWPPLIALYNLHSYTEDFGCSRVLPYAKFIKKAGWCLDFDFKARDKLFKQRIIETYGESAKKNYKDYYFQFESTTAGPKKHGPYNHRRHITCSERFKDDFNSNLDEFLKHNDGSYKKVCPRFVAYQKKLNSGDKKLLSQLSFAEAKVAKEIAKREEQLAEWKENEEKKKIQKREDDEKRILEDTELVKGAEKIINFYTDQLVALISQLNIDNYKDFDFAGKSFEIYGYLDKGYFGETRRYCELHDINIVSCNDIMLGGISLFPSQKSLAEEINKLRYEKIRKLNKMDRERKSNEKTVIIFNDYYQGFKNNYSNNKEGWCKGWSGNFYWGNCKNPKSNVEKWAEQKSKNKKKTKKCTLRVGGEHCYYE